jgi:hypothetical protein
MFFMRINNKDEVKKFDIDISSMDGYDIERAYKFLFSSLVEEKSVSQLCDNFLRIKTVRFYT